MTRDDRRLYEDVYDITQWKKFKKGLPGFVDGYSLDNIAGFHQMYDKRDAVEVLESDDCACVTTTDGQYIRIAEDGKKCYQMKEHPVGLIVVFNSSCYLF